MDRNPSLHFQKRILLESARHVLSNWNAVTFALRLRFFWLFTEWRFHWKDVQGWRNADGIYCAWSRRFYFKNIKRNKVRKRCWKTFAWWDLLKSFWMEDWEVLKARFLNEKGILNQRTLFLAVSMQVSFFTSGFHRHSVSPWKLTLGMTTVAHSWHMQQWIVPQIQETKCHETCQ